MKMIHKTRNIQQLIFRFIKIYEPKCRGVPTSSLILNCYEIICREKLPDLYTLAGIYSVDRDAKMSQSHDPRWDEGFSEILSAVAVLEKQLILMGKILIYLEESAQYSLNTLFADISEKIHQTSKHC